MKQTKRLLCWLLGVSCSAAITEVDVINLQAQLMVEIEQDTRKTKGYTGRAVLHPPSARGYGNCRTP